MRRDRSTGRQRGHLYVIEGPDGVGKSTLARAFANRLQGEGIECDLLAFPGAEPGTLGLHVYQMHHHPERFGVSRLDATSKQVLHVAAHIDVIENRIRPALQAARTVVLDRFWWSTWVYGLESGVPRGSLRAMLLLEQEHWRDIVPDAVFLVQRDPKVGGKDYLARHRHLKTMYSDLAKETRHRNVHLVSNDRTVHEAVEQMLTFAGRPPTRFARVIGASGYDGS